jgi:uncharacterized protein YidB (DUF937 family)
MTVDEEEVWMKTWILAVAGVAVVAAVGAGAVMAQTPGTSTGTSFLDRVAQKLGIDTPKLQNAITSARTDQIDAAVANGDLTQKQADALKQRLSQAPNGGAVPGFGGRGFGGKGFGGPGGVGPGFGFSLRSASTQLAQFLGITEAQLKTELSASNATLATVAQAHGKSRDDLKTFITNTAKSTLDTSVKNGDITQKVEDNALSQLSQHLDQLIDGKFLSGMGKGFGGRHGMGPNAQPGTAQPGTAQPGTSQKGGGMGGAMFRS